MNYKEAFAEKPHIDDLIQETKEILKEKNSVQEKIREYKI